MYTDALYGGTKVPRYFQYNVRKYFQVLSYNVVRIDICFSQDRASCTVAVASPSPTFRATVGL